MNVQRNRRWSTPVFVAACLALLVALGGRATARSADIVISQVYGGGGTAGAVFTHDFVELFNRGSAPVNVGGWSIQYGSATGKGAIGAADILRTVLPDVTIPPGHYLLIQEAAGGYVADLPIPDVVAATPISFNANAGKVVLVSDSAPLGCNGGSIACSPAQLARIVDLMGYGTANFFEGEAAPALTDATAAVRFDAGCVETDMNGRDFVAAAPMPRNGASPAHTCAAAPPSLVPIHVIQGAGDASPRLGETVTTTGIVTALREHGSRGFFIEATVAESDSDVQTSEGLFVAIAPNQVQPAIGDRIIVTGMVTENGGLTQLSSSPVFTVVSAGNTLPDPVWITGAAAEVNQSASARERYESMRVGFTRLTVVGPTGGDVMEASATVASDGRFVTVMAGTPRPVREPGIEKGVPAPAGAPAGIPEFDGNPERWVVDSLALGGNGLDLPSGASVDNAVGSLCQTDAGYVLLLDVRLASVSYQHAAAIAPLPAASATEFTVAGLNLHQFYDSTDDAGADIVLTPEAFTRRLRKASIVIRDVLLMPDILGVTEVENLETLQALAWKINGDAVDTGQGNPGYLPLLLEGHDPALLDVGFLVKQAAVGTTPRVTVVDYAQIGTGSTCVNADNGATEYLSDRPSLALRARLADPRGGWFPLTVIVNQLQSRAGIETDQRVRDRRARQAAALAREIAGRQAAGEHLILVGDFEAFPFSDGYVDVMGTVIGTPTLEPIVAPSADLVDPDLVNLLNLAPADQRYSQVAAGNAQQVDHVVIDASLLPRLSGPRYAVARVGADFPAVLYGDGDRPERLSDHDAPVAYFSFPSADMKASQAQQPNPVLSGGTITYRVSVENRSPASVYGVSLRNTLPTVTTLAGYAAPSGWSCAPVSEGLTCQTDRMPAGVTATFTIEARVPCDIANGTDLVNIVEASSATFDPDPGNNRSSGRASVDNPPPAVGGAAASPALLWPANHQMLPVTIDYSANDCCDPAPACRLSVASSEPTDGRGDGRTATDWAVLDARTVWLRAERSGTGNGRTYTVTITCSDSAGGTTARAVAVVVPKNRK